MAWSVDNIYNYVKFLIRKNQAGGVSATDLFYAWNGQQKSYQSDLLGRWQNRSNNKTGNNIGLIEDETILTKLSPFVNTSTLTITTGQSNKPTGFIWALSMRNGNEEVFYVKKDEIYAMSQSVIDPASATLGNYYYTDYLGYFKFFPSTMTTATLDYIVVPTDVVWGYTLDGDGRQVYSSGTSVQPEWDDLSIIDITKRALKELGVSFKDADFANFGQSAITTGD